MLPKPQILPYSRIVGQDSIKLALELAYIAPTIGGVLLSGHRGTGKSTAVRAFALMMSEKLPVTLPINATEDRVIGGWKIVELMRGEPKWQDGLLKKANDGMLYVDEVNLLDDHIVNIILDVTSTGVLEVQRDARDSQPENIAFTLVGTMNPEEGSLRPQLLDRFGLMVNVTTEADKRSELLDTVLKYDKARFQQKQGKSVTWLEEAYQADQARKTVLEKAKQQLYEIRLPEQVKQCCIALANAFQVEGHRNDYVMALATQANAALKGVSEATVDHVKEVANMSIQHRRPEFLLSGRIIWSNADTERVQHIIDSHLSTAD
ncbi:MAG: AAA family ATPase [Candidatus Parabeggiatoa sp.]|nr:AAA family ATPase [Candidatus Parabeggiatoa sp.]